MKRSKISAVFVLVSFVMMLVHTVIPHHHHQSGAICFHSCHCPKSERPVEGHPQGCSHEHGTADHEQFCILKQVSILPSGQTKIAALHEEKKDTNTSEDKFVAVIPDLWNQDVTERVKPGKIPDFQITLHPLFYTPLLNLRAPPVI